MRQREVIMKRRRTIILCICALLVCIFAGILTACGAEQELEGVQVVYECEGGTYKNGVRATHYYDLKPGAECLLVAPESVDADELRRPGFTFDGWYRTRTEDPVTGKVTYSDPWDFEKDTITSDTERVTLYAAWKENFKTYYELCYRGEDGEEISIAKYDVLNGSKFDNSAYYNKVDGLPGTPDQDAADKAFDLRSTVKREYADGASRVCYYDENGNAWDPDFLHPGDEGELTHVVETKDQDGNSLSKECTVKVFVEFEEGLFSYASNVTELKDAIADRQHNKSIKLLADIDFGGETFDGFADSTTRICGGLKNIVDGSSEELFIDGQNHVIKNFELGYNVSSLVIANETLGNNSLVVSLFGLIDHVRIQNISFTGVTIDLSVDFSRVANIYVAPLALTAVSSEIVNVSFTGTYKTTKLPSGFIQDNLVVERTNPVHFPATETVIGENVTVSLTDPA